MTLLAADISSHNTISNWPAFLASVDIVTVKVSEGSGYVWPGAPAALAYVRGAGKLCGAYHFYGGGDPIAEADWFLTHYQWRPGEVPILDWEPTNPPADPDGVAAAFSQRLHDRLGVTAPIYMNSSTAQSGQWTRERAAGARLWVAQYGINNGQPGPVPAVGAWGSPVEWQYTSAGTLPGVSGPIDLSQFYGDAAAWRALGTPGGTDMPLTPDDIAAIWAFPIGGTNARDRLQGIDTVVNWMAKNPPAAQVDVAALAGQIVAALPTAEAQKVADLVLAGIAAKLNTPHAAPPAA
jgi:GH25 family lysozyme M1 (1,4-beta-N-acetylmuramidase)